MLVNRLNKGDYLKGLAKKLVKCPNCSIRYNLNNKKQFGWYRLYMIPYQTKVKFIIECKKCHHERYLIVSKTQFHRLISNSNIN